MKAYKYTFTDIVIGNSFAAKVKVCGAVLFDSKDDFFYGVAPVVFAGKDKEDFRRSYRSVLFDFAEDAIAIGEFKSFVCDCFDQKPEISLAEEWKKLAKTDKFEGFISIENIEVFDADENELDDVVWEEMGA